MDSEKKEVGAWWVWILSLTVLSIIALTSLNYFGILGRTIVERKVFENSFQYSEARKSEIVVFEAQLVEIDIKLSNPSLSKETRTNIEAQASAIRIHLNAARRK